MPTGGSPGSLRCSRAVASSASCSRLERRASKARSGSGLDHRTLATRPDFAQDMDGDGGMSFMFALTLAAALLAAWLDDRIGDARPETPKWRLVHACLS